MNEGNLINDGYEPGSGRTAHHYPGREIMDCHNRGQREEKATGLSSLKVKYNKVFGYFIEVSKAQSDRVPENYIRKQTLVNAERFITQEMKAGGRSTIFNAQDRRNSLEYEIFCKVRDQVALKGPGISLTIAEFIATPWMPGPVPGQGGIVENGYAKPRHQPERPSH